MYFLCLKNAMKISASLVFFRLHFGQNVFLSSFLKNNIICTLPFCLEQRYITLFE